MKYYTSIKLNTKAMIGPWSMKNAIIIIIATIIVVPMFFQKPYLLMPLFVYIVGAIEIDGRTLFHKSKIIMSYIISDKKYSLKEAVQNEDDRLN